MMFLQYAVWGVWLPYLANYLTGDLAEGGLGFTLGQVGWILALAGSIGAVTAPFVAGQLADRVMNAERSLGLLLVLGGCIKYATWYAHSYASFLTLSIAYSVVYMPTLALTNSIAFAHLDDPEQRFPRVRTWGTIGWIVASNVFPLVWLQTNLHVTWLPPFLAGIERAQAPALIADCLRVSGVAAVLYGIWATLFLPRTPPTRGAVNPLAFLEAFRLLRHPGVLVVTLVALPIAMIHQVYFIQTAPFLTAIGFSQAHVGPVMSIGQFSEIGFLALLGVVLRRIGYRWTLVLGCLAYFARFAVFAVGTEETRSLVATANALHGLCYGFFFAGAYVYIDRIAPKDIRHSIQTVFGIVILGLGPILAAFYNVALAAIGKTAGPEGSFSWGPVWWIQASIGLAMAAVLLVLFRPGIEATPASNDAAAASGSALEDDPTLAGRSRPTDGAAST